jgi:uncharacterized membrane protein
MTTYDTLRSIPNYFHARQDQSAEHFVNVGAIEREVSTVTGAGLAVFGLSRRSIRGLLLAGLGGVMIYRGVSGHCHAYQALGVNTNHDEGASPNDYFRRGIHVVEVFTVNKPASELFNFWRDFTNLPKFMTHLESVEVLDNTHSRWTAKGPAGSRVTWDAEIINEEPDRVIAWRSLAGADVDNSGSVRFVDAPGNRGTEVRVVIEYIPPAGRLGKYVAMLFGEAPEQTIREDLRRFKQLMKSGEVAMTKGEMQS